MTDSTDDETLNLDRNSDVAGDLFAAPRHLCVGMHFLRRGIDAAFVIRYGDWRAAWLKVLFIDYAAGVALAALLTIVAISTRIGTDFLETVTAMFNPLPCCRWL